MSKAKFEAAKELIQAKQYDQARAILRTINDPRATDWLSKLDQIAPEKKKRSRRGCIIAVVTVAVLAIVLVVGGIIAADQIGKRVLLTLTADLVSVDATSTTPIPAKLSTEQVQAVANECMRVLYGNSLSLGDYIDSQIKYMSASNFEMIGALDWIYTDAVCPPEKMFQLSWNDYTDYKGRVVEIPIDKGVAWTKYIQGWYSAIQSNLNTTATYEAYRASQPTEVMATNAPPPTVDSSTAEPLPTRTRRPTLTPLAPS